MEKLEVPVKDKEGKAIFGRERWREHFRDLLNRFLPSSLPEILQVRKKLTIYCDPPFWEEIVEAIGQLKKGKAAASDQIPLQALKVDALYFSFAKIWTDERIPQYWNGHLVKIPKKGDLSACEN